MAKRKAPVRKKQPPKKPESLVGHKANEIIIEQNTEVDYVAAGKHLADALKSLTKAVEAVTPARSKTYTTSWQTLVS